MATSSNSYKMNDDERLTELMTQAREASDQHLEAATYYMLELLQKHDIRAAMMGGYSLKLRGSPRRTYDADIGVQTTMRNLREKMQIEQRLIWPLGLLADVVRCFIRTGGEHDASSGHEQLVQIDLKLEGEGGITPGIEEVQIKGKTWPIYDIPTMMRLKLKSFDQRDSDEDLHDIEWLVLEYPDKIAPVAGQLDYGQREHCLREYHDRIGKKSGFIRQVLGIAWPPEE